ncbi:hypothetical protein OF83DRAFT_369061 [Amylostereum chailletii]|nr:hypothetical protein OF83DRAFT_369061 [Amylostereum chailletii]
MQRATDSAATIQIHACEPPPISNMNLLSAAQSHPLQPVHRVLQRPAHPLQPLPFFPNFPPPLHPDRLSRLGHELVRARDRPVHLALSLPFGRLSAQYSRKIHVRRAQERQVVERLLERKGCFLRLCLRRHLRTYVRVWREVRKRRANDPREPFRGVWNPIGTTFLAPDSCVIGSAFGPSRRLCTALHVFFASVRATPAASVTPTQACRCRMFLLSLSSPA